MPKIIEVVQVDSVYDTIKQVIELRDRSISSLTLERLVKKFCQAYENLDPQQKQDVLLHLGPDHVILTGRQIMNLLSNFEYLVLLSFF